MSAKKKKFRMYLQYYSQLTVVYSENQAKIAYVRTRAIYDFKRAVYDRERAVHDRKRAPRLSLYVRKEPDPSAKEP